MSLKSHSMEIKIATCSFQGGRNYNEDSVLITEKDGAYAVIVADGLGGHGGGEEASSMVAGDITQLFFENPNTDPAAIQSIFKKVNSNVLSKQTPQLLMRSTGICLFMKDNCFIWAHVGDSRLYHFYNDRLLTHTLDHSVSQVAVLSGEITQEEIRSHIDRNKVTRAFGGNDDINAEVSPPLMPGPGDHVFLLCTDGFWEYVFEQEMELDLSKCKEPGSWLDAMCARINRRAPSNNDNFSAAAVFCRID